MERQDGHDPFDPQTYYAENGLTIATMLELRVFCASFFESHVRHNIKPAPEETMARFIKLITDSGYFFARARAVIPELQVPNTVSFHENINTCHILLETRRFRGPPGKRWSIPADESAWSKLSNDGRAMLEKKAREQREQGNDVSAGLVTSTVKKEVEADGYRTQANRVRTQPPLSESGEEVDAKEPRKQASETSALASLPPTTKIKAKLEIHTFIPQDMSSCERLVWSPTQGTRPARPDEVFQILASSPARSPPRYQEMPTSDAPKENMGNSSEKLTVLPTGLSLHNSAPLSPTSRALGNQSPFGPIGPGSAPGKKRASVTDAVAGYPPGVPLQASVHAITESQRQSDCHRSIKVPSGVNGPEYIFKRTRGVAGVEPFSTSPTFAKFQGRHDSGQWRYGKHSKYHQPPMHPPIYYPTNSFTSNSDSGSSPPGPLYRATDLGHLLIPAQGFMKPIDYWDLLYRLEGDLCERLRTANEPITPFYQLYTAQLQQARMMAISTKLPHRGRMDNKVWLQALRREIQSIWTHRPGQIGDNPRIMARKRDYESVVNEEIGKVWLEG